MKEISDVTCCVVDSGLFLPMALRMRDTCKRVLYFNPDFRAWPSIKQGCIGDGFDGVEVIKDFWQYVREDLVDLFCFPDSRQAGLQIHLQDMGKSVWGSRYGQDYEQKREMFMNTLGEVGLDVPEYTVCKGIHELEEHICFLEDQYVKVSHWRGDIETTHWRNWAMDHGWLDWLRVSLGPLARVMVFLVFPKIETDLEIGVDTYCVDGEWPSLMINGIEGKDKSYLAAVTAQSDMPEQLSTVMAAFSQPLKQRRYRNQFSGEVRVKDDKAYFIDFTARGGMPSTASQHLLWKNFPEIVWAGANGELVEPETAAMFSIETMITSKGGHDTWDVVEIPDAIEPYCRFSNCCYYQGCYVFPPDDLRSSDLGWLCAIGDTPTEALEKAKEYADELPDGLNADVEALADVIKEVESAREQGIPFAGHKKMPKPAEVLS